MRIHGSSRASYIARHVNSNANNVARTLRNLASGFRINTGGDDAAGLAVSEKLRTQVAGLKQAQANVQDGISMVQTVEGALVEIGDMLQRMRGLALEAANGILTSSDRSMLQAEVDELTAEIDRITQNVTWNKHPVMEAYVEDTAYPPENRSVEVGYLVGDIPGGEHTVTVLQAAERHIIETAMPTESSHEQDRFTAHQVANGTPVYNTGQIDYDAAIADKTEVGVLDEVWSVERPGSEFLLPTDDWAWTSDADGGVLTIPGTSGTNAAIEFDANVAPTQAAAWRFNIENTGDATATTLPIRDGSITIRDGDGNTYGISQPGSPTFVNTDTNMVGEAFETGAGVNGFDCYQSVTDENVTATVAAPWTFTTADAGYDMSLTGANPVIQNDAQVINGAEAAAGNTGYTKNHVTGAAAACTMLDADTVAIGAAPTNELQVTAVHTYAQDVAGEAFAVVDTTFLAGQVATAALANGNISNAAQTGLGSFGDSSLSWAPGAVLTNEVAAPGAVAANGDYYVDYATGQITYMNVGGGAVENATYAHRKDYALPADLGAVDEATGRFDLNPADRNAGDTVYVTYDYVSGVTINAPGRNGGTIDLIGANAVVDGGGPLANGVDYNYNNGTGVITYLNDNAGGVTVDYDYDVTYNAAGAAINSGTGQITLAAAAQGGRPTLGAGGTVLADYTYQSSDTNFIRLEGPSSFGGNMMIKSVNVNGLPGGRWVTGYNAATGQVNFNGGVDPGTLNVDYVYRAQYTVTNIDYTTGDITVNNPGNNTPDPTGAANIGDYTFDYDWYHTVRIGYYQLDRYPLSDDTLYITQDVDASGTLNAADATLTAGPNPGEYERVLGGIRINGQAVADPDPDYDGSMENPELFIDYAYDTDSVIDTHAGGQMDNTGTPLGERVPTIPGDAANNDGLFNDFWGNDSVSFTCDGKTIVVPFSGTDTPADLIERINTYADDAGAAFTASYNETTNQIRLTADYEGSRYDIGVNDQTFGPAGPEDESRLNFTTIQNSSDPIVRVTLEDGTTSVKNSDSNYFSIYESGIPGVAYRLDPDAVVGWESALRRNKITLHTGANDWQQQDLIFRDMRASSLGVDRVDISTMARAESSIETVDTAMALVADYRAYLGALVNTLEHHQKFLGIGFENQTMAESRIRDADMAGDVSRLTRQQIQRDASQSMLAQANISAESVLQLLA